MIQSFKNITITMAHKTNAGMTDGSHVAKTTEGGSGEIANIKDIEAFRVKGDLRYTPVVLKADGLGYALAQVDEIHGGGTEATPPVGAVIGVLMESFSKPMHGHEVMIHGIVGMKAKEAIVPGIPVYWDETSKKITKTPNATSGKGVYYIGLSLTQTTEANQYVDVLIGK